MLITGGEVTFWSRCSRSGFRVVIEPGGSSRALHVHIVPHPAVNLIYHDLELTHAASHTGGGTQCCSATPTVLICALQRTLGHFFIPLGVPREVVGSFGCPCVNLQTSTPISNAEKSVVVLTPCHRPVLLPL